MKVDAEHTFGVLIPVGIDFGDTRLGLPSSMTFTRSSIYAISDFGLDV